MAENHIQPDKMAVNSVEQQTQSTTPGSDQAIVEDNDAIFKDISANCNPDYVNTRKKSSFQITRVIPTKQVDGNDQADGEVDDDLDETATEELSSELLDVSKATDPDHDPPSASEDTISAQSTPASGDDFQKDSNAAHIPTNSTPHVLYHQNHVGFQPVKKKNPSHSTAAPVSQTRKVSTELENSIPVLVPLVNLSESGKEKASESRFKVVKIESEEPFRRGRWSCLDYLNPPLNERSEKTEDVGSHGSGSSSAASSVHYIPGVDDPARNPLLEGQVSSQNGEFCNSQNQTFSGNQQTFSNGTHIMPNASMPSQHIPTQVPSSMTQTHMQNVLPPESISQPFSTGQSSASAGNGQASLGQGAQSQTSFSQANVPHQIAKPVMHPPQQNVNNDKEFIPQVSQQNEFIPNTTNSSAQNTQEMSSKTQSQSNNNSSDLNNSSNNKGVSVQNSSAGTQLNSQPAEYVSKASVPSNGASNNTSPSNENVQYSGTLSNNDSGEETNKKSESSNADPTPQGDNESNDQLSLKMLNVPLKALEIGIAMQPKSDDEGYVFIVMLLS